MLTYVWLALLAASIFYVLMPVAGAFIVRHHWRKFRQLFLNYTSMPELTLQSIVSKNNASQIYSFYGVVEAIIGEHELCLSSQNLSCYVDLHYSWVYILVKQGGEYKIERIAWNKLKSITFNSRAFVAGYADLYGSKLMFKASYKPELLVILYDDNTDFITNVVWAGRHENEYWNPITQVSIALGIVVMSLIVSMSTPSSLPAVINAIIMAIVFSPILPLLPPGVIFFFAYKKCWKEARIYRANRDTANFKGKANINASSWNRKAWISTATSAAAFVFSLLINAWIFISIFRRFL